MDAEARRWVDAIALVDEDKEDVRRRMRLSGLDPRGAPHLFRHVRRSQSLRGAIRVFRDPAEGSQPSPFPTNGRHGALIPERSPWWAVDLAFTLTLAGLVGEYPVSAMDRPALASAWERVRDHRNPTISAPALYNSKGDATAGPSPAELAATCYLAIAKSAALAAELGLKPAPAEATDVGTLTFAKAHARGLAPQWLHEAHQLLGNLAAV